MTGYIVRRSADEVLNAQAHRAGPDDPIKAEQAIVAGSGASPCRVDGVIDGSKS